MGCLKTMRVREAREARDSTRWKPFCASLWVTVLPECWCRESLSAKRTMTYFPETKHFTCGMSVFVKKNVLMSSGRGAVKVYLRVRSGGGGGDAIVGGASDRK